VANVFPVIAKAAWAAKKKTIIQGDSTAASKNFTFKMRRRQYNKQFGKGYKRPGSFSTIVSFFIRVLPKAGPTRALRFKAPNALAEKYFVQSFDTIMKYYSNNINQLRERNLSLKDKDYDTGMPTVSCEYELADYTYDEWLVKLYDDKFKNVSNAIKQNILSFFHIANASNNTKHYSKKCLKFFKAYGELSARETNH